MLTGPDSIWCTGLDGPYTFVVRLAVYILGIVRVDMHFDDNDPPVNKFGYTNGDRTEHG